MRETSPEIVKIGSRVEVAFIDPSYPMEDGRQEVIQLVEEGSETTSEQEIENKKGRLVSSESELGRAVLGAHAGELRRLSDAQLVEIVHIL